MVWTSRVNPQLLNTILQIDHFKNQAHDALSHTMNRATTAGRPMDGGLVLSELDYVERLNMILNHVRTVRLHNANLLQ